MSNTIEFHKINIWLQRILCITLEYRMFSKTLRYRMFIQKYEKVLAELSNPSDNLNHCYKNFTFLLYYICQRLFSKLLKKLPSLICSCDVYLPMSLYLGYFFFFFIITCLHIKKNSLGSPKYPRLRNTVMSTLCFDNLYDHFEPVSYPPSYLTRGDKKRMRIYIYIYKTTRVTDL